MIKDNLFYKLVRPFVYFFIKIFFRPQVVGLENVILDQRVVFAGNHTKWLDPVLLVGVTKRQIHFLAKDELFHGMLKFIVKGMGCIPVNRRIHDKNALEAAYNYLNNDLCVGIFPEGTINRENDIILPFKIGACKACSVTNSKLVPFVITGKYRFLRRGIKIEFLKPRNISDDLTLENEKFMEIISNKIVEGKDE